MEDRKATLLFYSCNSLNAILCFFAVTPASKVHPLLPFLLPYLYFAIRLSLYQLWYRIGYHPLPQRRYVSGPKGGLHLPVFTKNTEEYKSSRQHQSLKYQIIYNLYKVFYRTIYFVFLMISISLLTHTFFTADNRYPGSPLQEYLMTISGGSRGIEKILFVGLILLIWMMFLGLYKLGKLLWQKHFYKRYPVTVLLIERDEPIFTVKESEQTSVLI